MYSDWPLRNGTTRQPKNDQRGQELARDRFTATVSPLNLSNLCNLWLDSPSLFRFDKFCFCSLLGHTALHMTLIGHGAFKFALLAGAAFTLMLDCQFARGQSLDEIDKRDAAVREAWEKTPFTLRNACLVTEGPQAFGAYKPRSPAPFKSGQQMIVYAEPVGYVWKSIEGDQYQFGFTVDLIVKTAAGKTILEKDNFGKMMFESRARNRELFLKLTVDLTGADPGDYLLDFRVHDAEGENKIATIELPITME
jgi:hypothetical protein